MIQREPSPDMLTTSELELGCWVVNGDDLEPGDVLLFLGEQHRIDRLPSAEGRGGLLDDVYPEPGKRVIVVGKAEFTWAVPSQMYRILPRVPMPVNLDDPEAVATELRRLGLPVFRADDVLGYAYREIMDSARLGGWRSPERPRPRHVNRGRLMAELERVAGR